MSIATSGENFLFTFKIVISYADLTPLEAISLLIRKNKVYSETMQKFGMLKDTKACGEKGAVWAEGCRAAGEGKTKHRWEPVLGRIKEN